MTEAETETESEVEKYEPPKKKSEVWKQIGDSCSFDIVPLPRQIEAMWHPRRAAFDAMFLFSSTDSEGKPMLSDVERRALIAHDVTRMLLVVDKPLQLAPAYEVFALYETDIEILVYAVSFAEGNPPSRFRLSKVAPIPIYTRAVMGWEVFVAEVANELSLVEASMTHATREKQAIVDYAETLPDEYRLADFISDIEEGKHHEGGDDDDDDEEDDEPEVAANGTAPTDPAPASGTAVAAEAAS